MKQKLLLFALLPLVLMTACGKTDSNSETGNSSNLSTPTRQSEGWSGRGRGGVLEISGLTDAQKEKIKQIQDTSHQQTDAVLTAEQKEQMRQARAQRQRSNLNLSDEQRSKINAIRQDSDKQIEAILTEEQRQQWQQLRQQRQQRRQQRQQQ